MNMKVLSAVLVVANVLSAALASILGIALIAVAFTAAFPDYEVEISAVSGKCKKVLYQGNKVPDGCDQVAAGKIARYTTTQGY
jgi:hypothetical protein